MKPMEAKERAKVEAVKRQKRREKKDEAKKKGK